MFVDSPFISSQREKRLELSKTQNTERRPSRVSSLRRKPSDSKSISHGAGHRQSLEPSIRPSAGEREPGRRGSEEPRRTSPPLSSSTDGTRRPLRSRPRQGPRDLPGKSQSSPVRSSPDSSTLKTPQSPPPPAPEETPEEVRRPRHPRSHPTPKLLKHQSSRLTSSDSSPPDPPPSPPQRINSSEEVRRPKSKPPLPPKPRIPAEPMFWPGPEKTTRAGPAPSPSHLPGSRPAADQETSVRGEDSASADPTPPIRRLQGGLEKDEKDENLLSSREEVKV